MFNKLSFLPIESVHPVCLALDDFEDDNGNIKIDSEPTVTDIIDADDVIGNRIKLDKCLEDLCAGALSAQEEEYLLRNIPSAGKVHDTALNTLISSFAEIIQPAQSQVGLKQIRLRVVPDEYIPEYYFDYEYLGYYDSYNAEIVLCPERISKRADKLLKQNRHITTRELYVVVLVNALAHALMDPTKAEGKSNQYQPLITTINKFTEREVLIENSLANMITLQYFEKLGQPDVVRYGEVREFIELQSLPYKFGLDQYDILKPDWRPWREAKRNTKFIKDK